MAHPIARNRSSTVGRAAEDRRTVQIADVLADADYGRLDLQRLTGFRTLMSTPMMLQDEVVGVLAMWRTDVAPFDDRERRVLEEFAVQGAIVLHQVDLMRALESRGRRAVGQGRPTRGAARGRRSASVRASTSTRSSTRRHQRGATDQPRVRGHHARPPTAGRSWNTTRRPTRSTSAGTSGSGPSPAGAPARHRHRRRVDPVRHPAPPGEPLEVPDLASRPTATSSRHPARRRLAIGARRSDDVGDR